MVKKIVAVKGYYRITNNKKIWVKSHSRTRTNDKKIQRKRSDSSRCKHVWERKEYKQNRGIVFTVYECEKCGKIREQCVGETWKPDGNWERKEYKQNQGIVFTVYENEDTGERIERCVGETWKPDQDGDF